jgi:hypothetical protein
MINCVVRSNSERTLPNTNNFIPRRVRSAFLRTNIIHDQLFGAHKKGALRTINNFIPRRVRSAFLRTKTITISFIGALNPGAHPTPQIYTFSHLYGILAPNWDHKTPH